MKNSNLITVVMEPLAKLARQFVNYNIFICYSTENITAANRVRQLVEKYGGIPFIAPSCIEGGKDPKEVIYSNIDNSDLFIPLISSKTVKSTYAHQEIGYAQRARVDVLPVVIGKVKKEEFGFLYDLHYEQYNTKKFKNTLKNRILKKYLKTIVFWTILLFLLIFKEQVGAIIAKVILTLKGG